MGSSWNETGVTGSLRQGRQPDGAPLPDLPIGNTFEPCPDMAVGSLRQGTKGTLDFNFTKGRGAGRTFEAVFPTPLLYNTSNGPGIDAISRYGMVNIDKVGIGQSPGDSHAVYYKGRAAFRMSAPTGIAAMQGPGFTLPTIKGGAKRKGDYHCWRVKAILAAEPGAGDIGIGLMQDGGTNLIFGTSGGMWLRPNADNTVTFYARPTIALGFTISDVCPIEIDVSEYNCYEYRLIGASDVADAELVLIINGREQFRYSFGDGLLPQGWLSPTIGSFGGGVMYLPIGGALVAGAYDEASLL